MEWLAWLIVMGTLVGLILFERYKSNKEIGQIAQPKTMSDKKEYYTKEEVDLRISNAIENKFKIVFPEEDEALMAQQWHWRMYDLYYKPCSIREILDRIKMVADHVGLSFVRVPKKPEVAEHTEVVVKPKAKK